MARKVFLEKIGPDIWKYHHAHSNNGRASGRSAELFAAASLGIRRTELFPSDSFRVKQQGLVNSYPPPVAAKMEVENQHNHAPLLLLSLSVRPELGMSKRTHVLGFCFIFDRSLNSATVCTLESHGPSVLGSFQLHRLFCCSLRTIYAA